MAHGIVYAWNPATGRTESVYVRARPRALLPIAASARMARASWGTHEQKRSARHYVLGTGVLRFSMREWDRLWYQARRATRRHQRPHAY